MPSPKNGIKVAFWPLECQNALAFYSSEIKIVKWLPSSVHQAQNRPNKNTCTEYVYMSSLLPWKQDIICYFQIQNILCGAFCNDICSCDWTNSLNYCKQALVCIHNLYQREQLYSISFHISQSVYLVTYEHKNGSKVTYQWLKIVRKCHFTCKVIFCPCGQNQKGYCSNDALC